jgi:hypothetical protein
MVRPLKVEISAPPGQVAETKVTVRNMLTTPQDAVVQTALLGQTPEGVWTTVTPGSPQDTPQMRSCLPWMTVSASTLKLGPLGDQTFSLHLTVPPAARGSYGAGLLVRAASPMPGKGGFQIVIQFLIPILVSVQGPPALERVDVVDAQLLDSSPDGKVPGAHVTVALRNTGQTVVRLGGDVHVFYQQGDKWMPFAVVPVDDRSMLPGIQMVFVTDLKRLLPGGTYRLESTVTGNGRRMAATTGTVTLKGNPGATLAAADVPLDFAAETVVQAPPGGTSSSALIVKNPSPEEVQVTVTVEHHPDARASGGAVTVAGADDASSWLEVTPATFTLRAGAERTLRVLAQVPETPEPPANSYALVQLAEQHTDGQNASQSRGLLVVRNPLIQETAAAQAGGVLLAQADVNKYSVTAQLANTGNVDWKPAGQVRVFSAASLGMDVLATALETEAKAVLPACSCVLSGLLDFSAVKAGDYVLHVSMDYGTHELTRELPLRVETDEKGNRTVSVINPVAPAAGQARPEETASGTRAETAQSNQG